MTRELVSLRREKYEKKVEKDLESQQILAAQQREKKEREEREREREERRLEREKRKAEEE